MFSAPMFVALWLCLAVNGISSEEDKVYVKTKIPTIPCIDNPVKDVCPSAHKVPDFSKIRDDDEKGMKRESFNKTQLNATLSIFLNILKPFNASKACKDAVKTSVCSPVLITQCKDDDDYITTDMGKVGRLCEKAKNECRTALPPLLLMALFNCSTDRRVEKHRRRGAVCQDFPAVKGDPYPCSKRKYKVYPSANFTELGKVQVDAHKKLKANEGKLDEKCRTNVAETICKIVAPACTKDGKKIVDLLSKQECYKIMGCVNATKVTDLIQGAHGMCDHLVDGTKAETIPLSDVETDETSRAAIQSAVSKMLLFALLYFVWVFM